MSLYVCVLLVLSSSIYFHFISTVLFLFFIISCIYLCRWSMSCVLKDVPKMYARIFLLFFFFFFIKFSSWYFVTTSYSREKTSQRTFFSSLLLKWSKNEGGPTYTLCLVLYYISNCIHPSLLYTFTERL